MVRGRGGLAHSVRVAAASQDGIRLRHGLPAAEDGWVTCAELLAGGLGGWADRVADWLRREYGEAPDRVVAGYLFSWYLTVPAQTGALLFHTARRVPRIGPADLAVRFDADHPRPAEIAGRRRSAVGEPGGRRRGARRRAARPVRGARGPVRHGLWRSAGRTGPVRPAHAVGGGHRRAGRRVLANRTVLRKRECRCGECGIGTAGRARAVHVGVHPAADLRH